MTDQTAGTGDTQTTLATETNAQDTTAQTTQTTDQTSQTDTTQQTQAVSDGAADANRPWIADDWREKIAGGDQKALARLQRFPDVGSVFKSFRELETRLSSGQLKQPLPDNPTPEQLAEYRQANGIPESPADYKIELSDGLVIGEADRPLIDGILEAAHATNASPQVVNAIVDEFYHLREEQIQQEHLRHEQMKSATTSTLASEWGADYKPNMMAVNNTLVAHLGQDVADMVLTAKLSDGSILGNNIEAIKGFARLSKELNPAGTLVPNAGGDQLGAIKDQISEMENKMKTNIRAWQHPNNEAERTRYRNLIEARDKLQQRGH